MSTEPWCILNNLSTLDIIDHWADILHWSCINWFD